MADMYIQRLAQVLMQYSLRIKKGDRLGIETTPLATPLVREVVREAVRAGAHPEVFLQVPCVPEILLKEGSDEQITRVPMLRHIMLEECETLLRIIADENPKSLSGVDPRR